MQQIALDFLPNSGPDQWKRSTDFGFDYRESKLIRVKDDTLRPCSNQQNSIDESEQLEQLLAESAQQENRFEHLNVESDQHQRLIDENV